MLINKMTSYRILSFIQLRYTKLIKYINFSHTHTFSRKCAKFLAIKTYIDWSVESQSEYQLGKWGQTPRALYYYIISAFVYFDNSNYVE